MCIYSSKRIVIKVGSALLVDEDKGGVNLSWLESLVDDISQLKLQGIDVIIVSSGAIALGKVALGIDERKIALDKQQAAAAVGQIQLLHLYQTLLQQKKFTAAQVLLTLDDTEDRRRYINLRNTFKELLSMDIIPIINENDSVATNEIRYGDNDRLAARVAQMVDADTLILLSDVDGLYTDDPRKVCDAKLITQVDELTEDITNMGKESSSNYGSGGMISKLEAAKIAVNSGCRMLITAGKPTHPIQSYMDNKKGTWFLAKRTLKKAKKIWLQDHLHISGKVQIDSGAVLALQKGASLLPAGIKALSGCFQKGSLLMINDLEDKEIAKGLSNYTSSDLEKIIGKKTQEIVSVLHYDGCDEVVHRDNLVLLD